MSTIDEVNTEIENTKKKLKELKETLKQLKETRMTAQRCRPSIWRSQISRSISLRRASDGLSSTKTNLTGRANLQLEPSLNIQITTTRSSNS